jgi:DNA invertase Pin-like site-specific DNA recombinase
MKPGIEGLNPLDITNFYLFEGMGRNSHKQVGLRILNLGMDTKTTTGKLMLTILGGIAQFEREMMLERQREGVAKAKGEGKYTGRKPIDTTRRATIIRLNTEGLTKIEIANQVGVGEATVYRVLAKARKT